MKKTDYADSDGLNGVVMAIILQGREEFFEFMKTFDGDITSAADPRWRCLQSYFFEWVSEKVNWHGGMSATAQAEEPNPRFELYRGPGTREFERFNELLPRVLLAIVDEVLRNPTRLDAAPTNAQGTPREHYRRDVPFLFSSVEDAAEANWSNPKDHYYEDEMALAMIMEPFPPVVFRMD